MISSKILAQSAAAGLMAGAILTSPLFLCGPDETSYAMAPCPYEGQNLGDQRLGDQQWGDQQWGDRQQAMHVEPAVIRAAPSASARQVDTTRSDEQLRQRSIQERNQAANQALQQINVAYEHSKAVQRGAQTAHTVRLHGQATQNARRIGYNANLLTICGTEDRASCRRLRQLLQQQGPLLLPSSSR